MSVQQQSIEIKKMYKDIKSIKILILIYRELNLTNNVNPQYKKRHKYIRETYSWTEFCFVGSLVD